MIRVRFVSADGASVREVEAAPGSRLLDVAQAAGQPLEGACEGALACSTCHVILAPADFARFPEPADAEEDMLDFAPGAGRYSRLSCQLVLTVEMGAIEVRMPGRSQDARA